MRLNGSTKDRDERLSTYVHGGLTSKVVIVARHAAYIRNFIGASVAVLFGCFAFLIGGASANANDIRCAQAFLDFKGFDPGPIDGSFGGRTASAAAQFAEKAGIEIAELSVGTADVWCEMAKADVDFARLLAYPYDSQGLWGSGVQSNRNYDQVLIGDSVGHFVTSERNVRNPSALGFVDLDDGIVAARILVRYEDEGHPDDWFWNDSPGVQQRFELTETRSFSMTPGNTYWLRMSIFVPAGVSVSSLDQIVLSDLKPIIDGNMKDPILDIKLGERYFQVDHAVGRAYECINGYSEGGRENTYCDQSKEQLFLAPVAEIRNSWINVVYRIHWADDDTGRFHLWLDDELMLGLAGDSSHGASSITNKFGIYRGFYGSQGKPQPPAGIYFTGIGRSDTCDGLGLSNCAALEVDVDRLETPGVLGTHLVEENYMTDYLEAGGRIWQ